MHWLPNGQSIRLCLIKIHVSIGVRVERDQLLASFLFEQNFFVFSNSNKRVHKSSGTLRASVRSRETQPRMESEP